MPDGRGNLWVRLGTSLVRYHNGVFDKPTAPVISRISAISPSNQGDPLVSITGHGAEVYREGQMEPLVEGTELPRSPVLAIAQTTDGTVWMGTRGSGLFRRHQGCSRATWRFTVPCTRGHAVTS